jgi:hypothetical protein
MKGFAATAPADADVNDVAKAMALHYATVRSRGTLGQAG